MSNYADPLTSLELLNYYLTLYVNIEIETFIENEVEIERVRSEPRERFTSALEKER